MMQDQTNYKNITGETEFWEGLQSDLFLSRHKVTADDLAYIIEKSFVYSLFFKGCSQKEISSFQSLLNLNNYGYILFITFTPANGKNATNLEMQEFLFYECIKKALTGRVNNTVGPMIGNRMGVIITIDNKITSDYDMKAESISLAKSIADSISIELHYSTSIGIGTIQSIYALHISYFEAIRCIRFCVSHSIIHILDLDNMHPEKNFDYVETEKHLLDAIRLRKIEAYDLFSILMDSLDSYKDEDKCNKILEILILSSRAMRMDGHSHSEYTNYVLLLKELSELKGSALIEWAYHQFIYMTRVVKPKNLIDYTNKIVLSTKEYLETHYAEDISLEDVADQVNISPQYFSKLIKKNTGFNFVDWLSMLRVKRAKELLSNPNVTVKEVCFLVGYKDPNYFSRIFKKRIGITPSEYVKTSSYLNNMN